MLVLAMQFSRGTGQQLVPPLAEGPGTGHGQGAPSAPRKRNRGARCRPGPTWRQLAYDRRARVAPNSQWSTSEVGPGKARL
jgi:hypothetical protein